METVVIGNLEWMGENFPECGYPCYYTWRKTKNLIKKIGDGWRLPTKEEINSLCDSNGYKWDKKLGGGLFKNKLFLPALGMEYNDCLGSSIIFRSDGHYWCVDEQGKPMRFVFGKNSAGVYDPHWLNDRYPIRLVRDVKKD